MAESPLPSPIQPREPLRGLGTLIRIAGSGYDGTTIYVKHPEKYLLDGQPIEKFKISGKHSKKDTGFDSGALHSLIFKNKDPYYQSVRTQTPNDGEQFVWKTVGAASFIDSNGDKIYIPRNELTLRKPKPAGEQSGAISGPGYDAALHEDYGEDIETPVLPLPEDATTQKTESAPEATYQESSYNEKPADSAVPAETYPEPPTPLTTLETRATEPFKSILLLGEDVEQINQAGAAKDIEQTNQTKNIISKIWKGNIAHELLEEHRFQFRTRLTETTQRIMSDEVFSAIESRADAAYTEEMNKKTKFGQAWTKFRDAVARNVGGYTTRENLAIREAGDMYAKGKLDALTELEASQNAILRRYDEDYQDADGVIRKNLGEVRDILSSGDPKHKEMMDGIKDIVHRYAGGQLASRQNLETALAEFAKTHDIGKDPKTGRAAQLYASSLYQIAEEIKQRVSSGEAMTGIDAQLDAMQIRIGRAQVGEATQFQQSTTEKVVTWMASKNLIGTLFVNEAAAGTAAAVALTLGYLPRYMASRAARLAGGAVGGGAVAGTIAGLKENARMKREFFQFMRQRETGAGDPVPGDKLREWMKTREIPQVESSELISRMVNLAYENNTLKTDLSGEDLTKTLAYLADAKARRSLSARGGENISLIRWGPAVDVGRTNLDLSINRLEKDLLEKYPGNNISDQIKDLTDAQTLVLSKGRDAASLSDPMKLALDVVSDHDIAVDKFRRKLGIWGEATSKDKAQGLDAALADIKTQIRLEAVRRGVTAGAIGTAIGTAISEGIHLGSHVGDLLHGGPQVTTEIPTHLTDVPNLVHITDAQGIDHSIQAAIPEHTSLVGDNATHTFTLMDDHNHALMHGIAINDHGQITNGDALNNSRDAIEHGLHIGDNTPIVLPGTEHLSPSGTVDLHASEWGPGGFWQYAQEKLSGQTIEYHNAATNASMQAIRGYELHFGMDPTGHVTNIDVNPPAGIIQNVQYHDTIWGKEVYFNAMPNTATIHVPASLFSDQSIINLGHAADETAKQYNDGLSHGLTGDQILAGMDRLHQIAFKIGYHGMEADIPTKEELQYLMDHLGSAQGTPEITLYQGLIEQTAATGVVPAAEALVTDLPAVVPLPREGMKPGKQTVFSPYPEYPMDVYKEIPEPPHYYDETPPSQEFTEYEHVLYETLGVEYPQGDNVYEISFSDRLRPLYEKLGLEYDETKTYQDHLEFLYDKIKIQKEIHTTTDYRLQTQQHYLDGLKTRWTTDNKDPRVVRALYRMNGNTQSYYQELEALNKTLPPMHKDCKFTVVIPTYNEQDKIEQTLTTWTDQFTSNENARIDPNSFEIIVLLNRPNAEAPYDQTRQRIEAFKQKPENATYHIHIVKKTFNIKNQDVKVNIHGKQVLIPKGRRMGLIYGSATDLAVLRNMTREAPDEIKANHILKTGGADVVARNPSYTDQTYKVFDNNPFIEQYTSRADYPSSIFEHVPLFHVTERFREFMNLQYTKQKSNLGLGVYRTSLYAEAGGFNPDDAIAEEVRLNERMRKFLLRRAQKEGRTRDSVIRKDTLLRAIDDPRRALSAVWQGIPMNHCYDNFWNNKVVKDMKVSEILKRPVPPEAQLTKENLAKQLGDYVQYYARMIYQYHPDATIRNNMAETIKVTRQYADRAFTFLGFEKGDYEWAINEDITIKQQVPDINTASRHIQVTFNNLSHLTQLLEEYKLRKKPEWTATISPKKSKQPRKIPTPISPAPPAPEKPAEKIKIEPAPAPPKPDELASTIKIEPPELEPKPENTIDSLEELSLRKGIIQFLDTHNGTLTVTPSEIPKHIDSLITPLAPFLGISADDMTVTPTHTGDTWHIEARTNDPKQQITADLKPDAAKGFSIKLTLKGFGLKNTAAGLVHPELVLAGLNGKLTQSKVTKLTLQPDGTIEFTGRKKG